jgi:PAS domain S-box-containing protein
MTDGLRHSISSSDGSSQNRTQNSADAVQPTIALDLYQTEALTQQILDSSYDWIQVLNLEGRILFSNRGGQALLDIQNLTSFLNASWIELWQGSEQQLAIEAIANANAGEVFTFQGCCPTLSGEPKWWDNKISPIRGIEGQIEQLLCISRDVTKRVHAEAERNQIENERKQAEERLRENEEHLSAIFSQAAVGLSELSLNGRFQQVNDELCRMLGRSREQLLMASVQDVTYPEDVPQSLEAFGNLVQMGEPISFDKRYLRGDGTIVCSNSSLTRLNDKQGQPRAVLAVTVDLSKRKQAEEILGVA